MESSSHLRKQFKESLSVLKITTCQQSKAGAGTLNTVAAVTISDWNQNSHHVSVQSGYSSYREKRKIQHKITVNVNVLDRALTVDEQPRRFADKPVCSQSTQTGQFADCYQQRRLCAELYHQRLSAIGRSATYRKWPEAFPDLKFSVDAGERQGERHGDGICTDCVQL